MAEQQTFSILRHDQKFLVIKNAVGKPLVVASCYLEQYADLIRDLLQKNEVENYANSNTKNSND